MQKNKILFITIVSVLVAQGCTVNVNPAAGVHAHEIVVPRTGHQDTGDFMESRQGTEGEMGIRGPKQSMGVEGQPGQLMGKNVQMEVPPETAIIPHTHAQKPDSAFGSHFWARVTEKTILPAILEALL